MYAYVYVCICMNVWYAGMCVNVCFYVLRERKGAIAKIILLKYHTGDKRTQRPTHVVSTAHLSLVYHWRDEKHPLHFSLFTPHSHPQQHTQGDRQTDKIWRPVWLSCRRQTIRSSTTSHLLSISKSPRYPSFRGNSYIQVNNPLSRHIYIYIYIFVDGPLPSCSLVEELSLSLSSCLHTRACWLSGAPANCFTYQKS